MKPDPDDLIIHSDGMITHKGIVIAKIANNSVGERWLHLLKDHNAETLGKPLIGLGQPIVEVTHYYHATIRMMTADLIEYYELNAPETS